MEKPEKTQETTVYFLREIDSQHFIYERSRVFILVTMMTKVLKP